MVKIIKRNKCELCDKEIWTLSWDLHEYGHDLGCVKY